MVTITTVPPEPEEPEERRVHLDLSMDEARVLRMLVGNVADLSPIRSLADELYTAFYEVFSYDPEECVVERGLTLVKSRATLDDLRAAYPAQERVR